MLNKQQRGMSLIELLVSMALGLLLLSAASSMALSSLFANKDGLRNMALEQEIQPVLSLMTRELRRSGYSADGSNIVGTDNKFFRKINMPGAALSVVGGKKVYTGGCVIFRYDRNGDNTLQNTEVSGFMLNNGQVLLLSTPTTLAINTCDPTDASWQPMNSIDRINVTTLSFVATTETTGGVDLINTINLTIVARTPNSAFISSLNDSIQLRNLPRVY